MNTPTSLQELVTLISKELGSDKGLTHHDVDVEKIHEWMSNYTSKYDDWIQYALWDKSRSYTRNLVDEGNGHYNIMILCWNEGKSSPIHDHSGSHCLMKVIQGELTETRYCWPKSVESKERSPCSSDTERIPDQKVPSFKCMKIAAENTLSCNEVTYISDELGLHRVGNKTNQPAVSLHLYTPPYSKCKLFDENTGACHPSANCVFFSRDGHVLFIVNYVTPENKTISVKAAEGDNLLDLAHANDIDLEGACECSLACSTCHVIVDKEYYDKIPEPSDEENDMLDLAFGLTENSRLGCQIKMTRELDGITVRIPSATRNVQQEKLN